MQAASGSAPSSASPGENDSSGVDGFQIEGEAKELKQARDAPLTFDSPETLKVQFNLRKKVILDLQRLHQVETSWSEMMMEWLLALEKEEEFEDEVAEWREKTTANDHA